MSGHFGMPGPGGSMGMCAVCGDCFIGGVVKDMMGMSSDIEAFSVGFVEQTLYCHAPKCKETIAQAFAAGAGISDTDEKNCAVRDALPDGPLKKALTKAFDQQEKVT